MSRKEGPSSLYATALRSANKHDENKHDKIKQYLEDAFWRPLSPGSCRICDKPVIDGEGNSFSSLRFGHAIYVTEGNVSGTSTRGTNYTVEHSECHTLEQLKKITLPDETTFEQELRERIKVNLPPQTEPSPSEMTEALKKTDAGFTGDWKDLGSDIQSLHLLAGPTGEISYALADGTRNIRPERLASILFRDVSAVQNSESGMQDQLLHLALKMRSKSEIETYIDDIFEVSLF